MCELEEWLQRLITLHCNFREGLFDMHQSYNMQNETLPVECGFGRTGTKGSIVLSSR